MALMQLHSCRVQAFLAASLKTDEELFQWFKERLVWSDPDVVDGLVKNGLFIRAYAPQVGAGSAKAAQGSWLCTAVGFCWAIGAGIVCNSWKGQQAVLACNKSISPRLLHGHAELLLLLSFKCTKSTAQSVGCLWQL